MCCLASETLEIVNGPRLGGGRKHISSFGHDLVETQ